MKVTFANPPVQVYHKHWFAPTQQLSRKKATANFWTPEEVKDLIAFYNSGLTASEISKHLGRSEGAVAGKVTKMLHDQTLWNLQRKNNGKSKAK